MTPVMTGTEVKRIGNVIGHTRIALSGPVLLRSFLAFVSCLGFNAVQFVVWQLELQYRDADKFQRAPES